VILQLHFLFIHRCIILFCREALLPPYFISINNSYIADLKEHVTSNISSSPSVNHVFNTKAAGLDVVAQDAMQGSTDKGVLTGFGVKGRCLESDREMSPLALGDLRDICFLPGYAHPSILLLHETRPTCVGRYAVLQNSTSLLSLSLDLQRGFHSTIACIEQQLPHDLYMLLPVPAPIGGALCVSPNVILRFNNLTIDQGLSFNEFGDPKRFSSFPCLPAAGCPPLSLDNAHAVFFTDQCALFGLNDGKLYTLELFAQVCRHYSIKNVIFGLNSSVSVSGLHCARYGFHRSWLQFGGIRPMPCWSRFIVPCKCCGLFHAFSNRSGHSHSGLPSVPRWRRRGTDSARR
jgi:hypothetical protein